ncbi:MAG: proline dehydrogenase family protein [Trueperaceae bacterium]
MFQTIYRRSLLGLAGAKPVEGFLKKRGMQLGVGRFVAGSSLEEAVTAAAAIEESGMLVILDLLGEFVDDARGAQAAGDEIVTAVNRLSKAVSDPAMSVKPSQLGLGLDFELALENARRIAEQAQFAGTHICLDMESHSFADGTLRLYRTLHEEGFENVSTVLQSYLKRSETDLEALLELEPRPVLRIVKGAYREPAHIAFQDKAVVDSQFRKLIYRLLDGGGKANIATHDERILREAAAYLKESGLKRGRYEYQMLYGVKPALQRYLREAKHPVRVYVPFGSDWYGYFSRRLAERPANLMFVVKGLFG